MNRYAWWKYAILAVSLLLGLLYAVPNLYGEAPAVQVSSGKATLKIDATLLPRVNEALAKAGLKPDSAQFDGQSIKVRLQTTDQQKLAKDTLTAALNPDPSNPSYIVALNLLQHAAVDGQLARPAHVPGPGLARWRALPDAGGHEGRPHEEGRCRRWRCAHPAA